MRNMRTTIMGWFGGILILVGSVPIYKALTGPKVWETNVTLLGIGALSIILGIAFVQRCIQNN
ncbi:hypothetical protein [Paenibacillus polymyxa]|uniref:hypothetical protein n=1 Tax=Paenibacillus polymyxa TaxID=1406 RepID=UPI0025B6F888|nr:hypothetical protein [Paenibacillus polymyxa]MDN4090958.1 hypothetical protein [Paenibacillus polymyxa]